MTGEIRSYEQKRNNFQKKVNFAESADSPDSDEGEEVIASAEWV